MLGANYSINGVKVLLLRGIDTLEFGLDINNYLNGFKPFLELFKALKEIAQEENKPVELMINGISINIEKSGMPFYAYRITCKDFIVGFTENPTATNPPVRVKLLSCFLWSLGAKNAVESFLQWFSYFNLNIVGNRISRVDICADSDKTKFVQSDIKYIVTRAKGRTVHFVNDKYFDGKTFSGFTIGKGNPILARIYNKTKEIIKSGKVWFLDLWEANDWHPPKHVWRVEFQLRREILKELQIDCLDDLWNKEDGLWSYLTGEWLLFKDNNSSNVSRGTVKKKWSIIQKAKYNANISPLVRQTVLRGDMRRLLDQTTGLVLSIAAGGNCISLEQALDIVKGYSKVKLSKEENQFEKEIHKRRTRFINNK